MTYKHNLSKGKGGKVISRLEWRTALAEILFSSLRPSKISSLISRRILIQKYSSKFKRGQRPHSVWTENVPLQKNLQLLQRTWEPRHFPFTVLCEHFTKVLIHSLDKRHLSFLSNFLNCHFFSRWTLNLWVANLGSVFSPPAKGNPLLPLPQQKSLLSTFHCTFEIFKTFKISSHLDLFRKIPYLT